MICGPACKYFGLIFVSQKAWRPSLFAPTFFSPKLCCVSEAGWVVFFCVMPCQLVTYCPTSCRAGAGHSRWPSPTTVGFWSEKRQRQIKLKRWYRRELLLETLSAPRRSSLKHIGLVCKTNVLFWVFLICGVAVSTTRQRWKIREEFQLQNRSKQAAHEWKPVVCYSFVPSPWPPPPPSPPPVIC